MSICRSSLARYYDFLSSAPERAAQVEFYRQLLSAFGNTVLEFGCGTGIITLALAEARLQVTGIDSSLDMLDRLREKMAQEPAAVMARISVILEDMRTVALGATFDVVIIPTSTLGYLLTEKEQRQALSCARNHLRPGGRLVIEESLYSPIRLTSMFERRILLQTQASAINPVSGLFTMYHWMTTSIDFISQTICGRAVVDEIGNDGILRRYILENDTTSHHYFTPSELRWLLEAEGFETKEWWGNYQKESLKGESRSMIVVAYRQG